MRSIAIIPARSGSKGLPDKNILPLCGKPLLAYSVEAALASGRFDTVHVSTDSPRYADIARQYGADEPFLRSAETSSDTASSEAAVREVLRRYEERGQHFDALMLLQPTSPLRTVSDIEALLKVHSEKHPDVTTSVTPARRNPYFNQVMRSDKGVRRVIESSLTARQQAPVVYDMNASLYAYSPKYLASGKGVLDGHCEIIEMYDTGILDLDHENDFELMEVIAKYLFEEYPSFKELKDNIK